METKEGKREISTNTKRHLLESTEYKESNAYLKFP
jgi:hypothetical protein